MSNNTITAACYMRYSSHAQDDGFSIEAQEKAIKRYAEEHGYDLQYYYCDKAKTGTNSKRPEFLKMIEDAKKKMFQVCIVHKTDRFARSRYDSIVYKSILKKSGVELLSVTENFGNDPEGKVMEGITEVFAEYYSNNLAREVRKGLDVIASQGLHTGGIPPLGYDVADKKLIINESEAEIVRLIFDRYSSGYTYNDIIKELNAKGYKTKIGREFTSASLNSILNQRKYIGEYVYNRRASKNINGSYNSHENKPEEEIIRIPNAVPKIIDEKTFEKVQQRLEMNKRKAGHYKSKSNYLLSGLIVCGECKAHYQGNTRAAGRGNKSMYSSYRCGKKQNHKTGCGNSEIEKNRLETFILEQMQKYLFSENAIKTIVKQVNEYNISVSKSKNSDLVLYEKQLKEINKQIKNISLAIAKGVNQELMIDQIKALDSSKKDLEKRIKESKTTAFPPIVEEDVRKALSKFNEFMKENNYLECKNFINQYIDKITVYKDKVEVTFKVASAIFNASFPDDKSGMVIIRIEISRDELKALPKQRRKVPANGQFGKSYLKEYKIVTL